MKTKKFRVTSETTFGQARVRGITKKEFQRRRNISLSLKQYHKSPLTTKKTFATRERIRKRKVTKAKKTGKRIRKQLAYYWRTRDIKGTPDGTDIGFIEIKALTINPDITEKGLFIAIRDKQLQLKQQGINFNLYRVSTRGFELQEIAPREEQALNDMKVHITVFANNKTIDHQRI